MLKITPHKGKR